MDNETKVAVARWCILFYLVDDLDLDWALGVKLGVGGGDWLRRQLCLSDTRARNCVLYSLFTYPTGVSGRHGVSIFGRFWAVDVVLTTIDWW